MVKQQQQQQRAAGAKLTDQLDAWKKLGFDIETVHIQNDSRLYIGLAGTDEEEEEEKEGW